MNAKSIPKFTRITALILILLYILSLGCFLYANFLAGDAAIWQMLINGILLSIPLILFYFSIGVIVVAARQKYTEGQITPWLAKLIYWGPRIAAIAIIFFISLFSLDVFAEGYTLGEMLLGFLMHMLPSITLMVVLILAWRWEWVGFLAFLAAAGYFSFIVLRNPVQGFGLLLLFAAPLFVIALLFGMNWQWRSELHPT